MRVSFVGCALTALGLGLLLDMPLALYFKQNASPDVVGFFAAITDLGRPDPWFPILSFIVFLALTAYYMDFREAISRRIGRIIAACTFVFLSVALSGLVVNVVKPLVGRHRPGDLFAEQPQSGFDLLSFDTALGSFPSGHAQMIFALAVALAIIVPRFDHFYLLAAVVIAFSRVAVSADFLSDVIVGGWIGIVAPVLLHRCFFAPKDISVKVQTCYRHPGLMRRIRDGLDAHFGYTPPPQDILEEKEPADER